MISHLTLYARWFGIVSSRRRKRMSAYVMSPSTSAPTTMAAMKNPCQSDRTCRPSFDAGSGAPKLGTSHAAAVNRTPATSNRRRPGRTTANLVPAPRTPSNRRALSLSEEDDARRNEWSGEVEGLVEQLREGPGTG